MQNDENKISENKFSKNLKVIEKINVEDKN